MPNINITDFRQYFKSGETLPLHSRRQSLRLLKSLIQKNEDKILDALHADLGKSEIEAYSTEIAFLLGEIDLALKNLSSWMRERPVKSPLFLWPSKSYVTPSPKGVVLILAPWNYPLQLLLSPFVGALAAGNCAVLKPSEYAPRTAQLLETMFNNAFHTNHVRVVQGDTAFSRSLTALPWDHIFFTGSTRAGREVLKTAAENLTPVTLELGGKNPCIVFEDTDLTITAHRIAWGKFLNCGQTCAAPDIVYAQKSVHQSLTKKITEVITKFYGKDPQKSPDFGRIINKAHLRRLSSMLEGSHVEAGGAWDENTLYFAPTVVTEVPNDSPLLKDEIFGPILPVIAFDNLNSLISDLQLKPVPLGLYLFTKNKALQKKVLQNIRSGTACINDVLRQVASYHLPFGGMRESGMGTYHGKASFDCFTHFRSIVKAGFKLNVPLHYPPYKVKLKSIKRVLRFLI